MTTPVNHKIMISLIFFLFSTFITTAYSAELLPREFHETINGGTLELLRTIIPEYIFVSLVGVTLSNYIDVHPYLFDPSTAPYYAFLSIFIQLIMSRQLELRRLFDDWITPTTIIIWGAVIYASMIRCDFFEGSTFIGLQDAPAVIRKLLYVILYFLDWIFLFLFTNVYNHWHVPRGFVILLKSFVMHSAYSFAASIY